MGALAFAASGAAWVGQAGSESGSPVIQSEFPDYNPGQTVTLLGANWDTGGTPVHIVVNDDVGQTWQHVSDVTPAADGTITDSFQLPTYFVAMYSVRATQETASGTLEATSTFTDANPSANLDQCANDPFPSPNTDGCDTNANQWVNGNLGASKANYFEGDSIPYRMRFDNLSLASHTVTIKWDTTKSSKHALDYLTTFNRTVATANPCLGVSGCSSSTTSGIPADPQVTGAGVTPVAGDFTLYGGAITAISAYSYPDGTGFAGDKSAQITITFTATVANPVLAWGGHISTRVDWGLDASAVSIPGSPYHTSLVDLDGAGGSQDRSLSADAVTFPGSITIVKDATPNGSTSFEFTASPAPLANFSLVDDGTTANTKVFSNITTFQTYTVNESSIPANWGFDSVGCVVTTPNGGSYTTSTTTVNVSMKEGENWTCTYLDSLRVGTLTVIKHVVNDNGGTKTAGDFTLHVKSGSTDVSGSPQAGSESGTSYTLAAGSYSVSEDTPPSGYTQVGFSGDCDSSGNVTVVVGQTKTCTITNDDIAPKLHLRKLVVNDNGGSATDQDFTLTADGSGSNDLSGTTPVDSGAGLQADTWALSETSLAGYAAGDWSCVGGTQAGSNITVGIGGEATCTITNDDIQPTLRLVKTVINDNGGTLQVADFPLFVDQTSVTSGVSNGFDAGSYTASETQQTGYAAGDWGGDCAANGSVTLHVGDDKTCTITNDDIAPKLHLRKVVVNDNGGSKTVGDFPLTADGLKAGNDLTGTSPVDSDGTLKSDTWTLSETTVAGYTASDWSCQGGTQNGNEITVGIGGEATCTITNDDQQAYVTVYKSVVNDNGGTAQPDDFKLTLEGNATTSGTKVPVDPGTHTAGETLLSGYTFSGFSGDCNDNGEVTVALGETKSCTLTNDDVAPKLHLRKVVTNDDGGTATVADFTLTANGTDSNDISGTSPVDSGTGLKADSFVLSETQLAGYTGSDWKCVGGRYDKQNGVESIQLGIGETATCTITNDDQQAYVTVVKVVHNNHGGTAAPNDFSLTLEGNAVSSGVAVPVNPGTYTAGETQLAGYTFEGFSGDCVGNGDVTVALGESKTCTLTNSDQQAYLTVVKHVINDNGGSAAPDDFKLTLEGNAVSSGVAVPVNPGTYTAGETQLAGYTFDGFSGDCGSDGKVTVALGESKTCTLTNDDQPGTLIVKKLIVNDNGGTKAAGDFAFEVNGGAATGFDQAGDGDNNALTGENHLTVDAGTYSVVEDGVPITGYATSYSNCSNVVVGNGDTETCLVTNDDIQPKLTLVKTVVNDNGGTLQVSDFPLFVGQTSVLSGVKNGFDAGTYTAGETQQTGYAAGSWGGDCAADGSITLHVGDDKTCTISNDDIQPKLTLVKTVVNDNGGTLQVSDFPLFVGQTSMTSGVAHGFDAGSYTASETGQYGYTASAWGGDCAANGSITLAVGDDKTCTITNDDQPGTIVVQKLIKPTGSLTSFSFTTSGTGYNTFSLSGGQSNSQTLNAGSYSVTELVPLGWVLTGIGGSSDPNTPYDCVVTGSGGSTGVGDLNTQTASIVLKNGDTVTCTFENTGQGVTRTQGFWATHPQLAEIAWFGGTAFGHTFPGVAGTAGIGDTLICGQPVDTLGKVMGGFWSSISKKSTGAKRIALDQARMQLLQQLLAAELNASAFGTVPGGGSGMFAQWEAALCGTNTKAISTAQGQAASFNTQGDSGAFTPGTSADSKGARSVADIPFWDIIKP